MGSGPSKPASNSGSAQQSEASSGVYVPKGPGHVSFADYTSGNRTAVVRNIPRPRQARPAGYNGGSRKRKNRKSKKSRKQRR